jgi:hypothetical protein
MKRMRRLLWSELKMKLGGESCASLMRNDENQYPVHGKG